MMIPLTPRIISVSGRLSKWLWSGAIILAVILICILLGLLWGYYQSQVALRESMIRGFIDEVERRATAAEAFFNERSNDLRDIVDRQELATYFANKDLGMSMEYGLRASLLQIENLFERIVEGKKIAGLNAYTGIVLLDDKGNTLAKKCLTDHFDILNEVRNGFIAKQSVLPRVKTIFTDKAAEIVVGVDYYYKGRYAGLLLGWINPQPIYKSLIESSSKARLGNLMLVTDMGDRYVSVGLNEGSFIAKSKSILGQDAEAGHYVGFLSSSDYKNRLLAAHVPVSGTPYLLYTQARESIVLGSIHPWMLLVVLGGVAILTMGGVVILVHLNFRTAYLKDKLAEEEYRKRAELEQIRLIRFLRT